MWTIFQKSVHMQRTPKNYDGTKPTGKTLKELLPSALSRIDQRWKVGGADLLKFWPVLIGPKLAKMTRSVSFEDGILTVVVQSSTLYSLLCQHEKMRLLTELREKFPQTQVRNIHFRIG